MARKRPEQPKETQRRSRKEVLRERQYQRQTREIRIAVMGIVGLLLLVLVIAIVNEYLIRPRQAVATVNGDTITLDEWQDRVRFERARLIIGLEDQLEVFQDVGLIQQFSGQQINLLMQPEVMGEVVLEQMIDEVLVRQAAEERDITVTDEEVTERIGAQFNFFGGELPTPQPTPTETIMPTPSLTPIPTAVITEVVPTAVPSPTPTLGPTATPAPTATPVSEEAFEEEYRNLLARYREMGVSEESYRNAVEAAIYREKLADALGEEEDIPTEAPHMSLYLLSFGTEEAAVEAAEEIEDEDFLTVWNTIRSTPADAEEPPFPDASATELLWRTHDALEQTFGVGVADTALELELETPSEIIEPTGQDVSQVPGAGRYYIIQVSGREVRPVAESALQTRRFELVEELVTLQDEIGQIERFPLWRTRVPTQPILDPLFLAQPTPAPAVATPTP